MRVIVPERSNHVTADLARAGYLRDLHEAGGRILLYTPVMLHAKAVVFDDQIAVIGSANMDMRSLFLNYEVALYVSSPAQVGEVAAWAQLAHGGFTARAPRAGMGTRALRKRRAALVTPFVKP